jgi:hypothetical protein
VQRLELGTLVYPYRVASTSTWIGAPLQIVRTDGLGYSSGPRAIRSSRGDPSGLTIANTK